MIRTNIIIVNKSLIDFPANNFIGLLVLGVVPTIFGHNSLHYVLTHDFNTKIQKSNFIGKG